MNTDHASDQTLLWLRAETKPFERRTPVTPTVAAELLSNGFQMVVERSEQRIFDDIDYARVGCSLVDSQAWHDAPSHAIILGLKELDDSMGPFVRRHVHFAHIFKDQMGWENTLTQYKLGGGIHYDLEYLTDDKGRRCAAFGYWAGFVGAACAVLAYAAQQNDRALENLQPWASKDRLVVSVKEALESCALKPTALIIGALGRCGSGAAELFRRCDLTPTLWDQPETQNGGPFDEIRTHDLLVNCVFIGAQVPAFTTLEHLDVSSRRLSVISDVSCDPHGQYNPLPVYTQCTTMDKPVTRLMESDESQPVLDLVAIDHLPSLLPQESSDDFSTQLLPQLLLLGEIETGVWARAKDMYLHHLSRLE